MEDKKRKLPLTTLNETVFWSEDDPRRQSGGVSPVYESHIEGSYDVNFSTDSYIITFVGIRGAGKSTSMTFIALKAVSEYNSRIVSNFPIECNLLINGKLKVVKSEPLDLYKLMVFDADYKGCLIIIDEAADIISHLAAMTWKNRLLNIFVRQLRKNRNTLLLGTQQFGLIDKSLRWQVDIIVECEDASRKYGWSPTMRGKVLLHRLIDNSGAWSGERDEDVIKRMLRNRMYFEDPCEKMELQPAFLWGTPGKTRPVFDTYFQQDIWESLRRVDMKLGSYEVSSPGANQTSEHDYNLLEAFANKAIDARQGGGKVETIEFWSSFGNLTPKDKSFLIRKASAIGIRASSQDGAGRRWYQFNEFDVEKFVRA